MPKVTLIATFRDHPVRPYVSLQWGPKGLSSGKVKHGRLILVIMACQAMIQVMPGASTAGGPGSAGFTRGRPGGRKLEEVDRMPKRCLLLALGNDILKDDGVGLAAAGLLRSEFKEAVDIVEAPGTGLALLELVAGYDRALLLDAIFTGSAPPGTVLEFSREDFQKTAAPSAHYVGLPEVLRQAESLGLEFPRELRILALEVENPFELHVGMSPSTRGALPGYVDRARQVLKGWIT